MPPIVRFAIACVCWWLASSASSATVAVSMASGNQFVPADITIAAFDTVTWTNNDAPGILHTATSDPGSAVAWDVGPILPGVSISKTFGSTLGTFPYHCNIHGAPGTGMHGTITVVTTPTISSGSTAHGTVNSPLSFAVLADQSPTTYGASGLPPGLAIDPATGVISGTPTTSTGSPFSANITATNVAGTGPAAMTFTIDALATGAPSITSAAAVTGTVGVPFSYPITATNLPTSFSVGILPPGLVFDAGTGLINGTPTVSGLGQVQIGASNPSGAATTTVTMRILPASSGSTATATAGTATAGYAVTGGGSCGMGGGSAAVLLLLLAGLATHRRLQDAQR